MKTLDCTSRVRYACMIAVLHLFAPAVASGDMGTCLSASGLAAVDACTAELNANPRHLEVRIALCDALIGARRYVDAVKVIEEGLERFPGNSDLESKLAIARSYVMEKTFIQRRNDDKKLDAMTKRNIIRCRMLEHAAALEACDAALQATPDDAALHTAKANALLDMQQYADAIPVYRTALQLDPTDSAAFSGLRQAEAKANVAGPTAVAQFTETPATAIAPPGPNATSPNRAAGNSEAGTRVKKAEIEKAEPVEPVRVAGLDKPAPKSGSVAAGREQTAARGAPPTIVYSNVPAVAGITH